MTHNPEGIEMDLSGNLSYPPDEAEPQPDTIGVASGTAKCHHCGEQIRYTGDERGWGWEHVDTSETHSAS